MTDLVHAIEKVFRFSNSFVIRIIHSLNKEKMQMSEYLTTIICCDEHAACINITALERHHLLSYHLGPEGHFSLDFREMREVPVIFEERGYMPPM